MKKRKLSIVLPVYNSERYLKSCLDALLNQTIENYEVICINDGSTDKSREILDNYFKKHKDKMKVFHLQQMGVWNARLSGIQHASGDYIGFCDSDDTAAPEMYEKLYQLMEESKADMAVCAFERTERRKKHKYKKEMTGFGNSVLEITENIADLALINAALWNKLFRAELLKHVIELPTPPSFMEDMIFLTGLYPFMKKIVFTEEAYYTYYVTKGSLASSVSKKDVDEIFMNILLLKEWYESSGGRRMDALLDFIVLVHIGMSLPHRISGTLWRDIKRNTNAVKKFLYQEFPGLKNCEFLKGTFIKKGNRNLYKIKIIAVLYRMGVFPIFLYCYNWMTIKLHIDMKW